MDFLVLFTSFVLSSTSAPPLPPGTSEAPSDAPSDALSDTPGDAPGDAPRCAPGCGPEEHCLETSQGWRCVGASSVRSGRKARLAESSGEAVDEKARTFRVMVSVERLFGWGTQTTAPDEAPEAQAIEQGYVAIFRGASASPWATPRLALDFALSFGLTLGGSASVVAATLHQPYTFGPNNSGNVNYEDLGFLVAFRAGYYVDVARPLAIWLRVGISYFNTDVGGNSDSSQMALAVTPEALALLRFTEYFGVSVGLSFDFPVDGSVTLGTRETGVKIKNSALTAGLVFTF